MRWYTRTVQLNEVIDLEKENITVLYIIFKPNLFNRYHINGSFDGINFIFLQNLKNNEINILQNLPRFVKLANYNYAYQIGYWKK